VRTTFKAIYVKVFNTKALGMTVGMTGGPNERGSFWYTVYWTCKL